MWWQLAQVQAVACTPSPKPQIICGCFLPLDIAHIPCEGGVRSGDLRCLPPLVCRCLSLTTLLGFSSHLYLSCVLSCAVHSFCRSTNVNSGLRLQRECRFSAFVGIRRSWEDGPMPWLQPWTGLCLCGAESEKPRWLRLSVSPVTLTLYWF